MLLNCGFMDFHEVLFHDKKKIIKSKGSHKFDSVCGFIIKITYLNYYLIHTYDNRLPYKKKDSYLSWIVHCTDSRLVSLFWIIQLKVAYIKISSVDSLEHWSCFYPVN